MTLQSCIVLPRDGLEPAPQSEPGKRERWGGGVRECKYSRSEDKRIPANQSAPLAGYFVTYSSILVSRRSKDGSISPGSFTSTFYVPSAGPIMKMTRARTNATQLLASAPFLVANSSLEDSFHFFLPRYPLGVLIMD